MEIARNRISPILDRCRGGYPVILIRLRDGQNGDKLLCYISNKLFGISL